MTMPVKTVKFLLTPDVRTTLLSYVPSCAVRPPTSLLHLIFLFSPLPPLHSLPFSIISKGSSLFSFSSLLSFSLSRLCFTSLSALHLILLTSVLYSWPFIPPHLLISSPVSPSSLLLFNALSFISSIFRPYTHRSLSLPFHPLLWSLYSTFFTFFSHLPLVTLHPSLSSPSGDCGWGWQVVW